MICWIVGLLIVSGLLEGIADLIVFKFKSSWFSKWKWINPHYSWMNKWKVLLPYKKSPWYYLGLHTPEFQERFPYSSTILVGFTDIWHLLKLMRNLCLFVGFSLIIGVMPSILIYIGNRVGFNTTYHLFNQSRNDKRRSV